MCTIFDIHS
jgi:cilia- and flagella-associated protein 57